MKISRFKIILLLSSLFLFELCLCTQLFAQECPRYSRRDREAVKEVVTIVAGAALGRMREISYLAEFPEELVSLGLQTQRMAFHFEYIALVSAIDYYGDNHPEGIRRRTKKFLETVMDSEFLGVAGTGLAGDTQEEAEENSNVANQASQDAVIQLLSCL